MVEVDGRVLPPPTLQYNSGVKVTPPTQRRMLGHVKQGILQGDNSSELGSHLLNAREKLFKHEVYSRFAASEWTDGYGYEVQTYHLHTEGRPIHQKFKELLSKEKNLDLVIVILDKG